MPFSPTYSVPQARQAYLVPAGPVGCLMIHGFMGSPTSSRPLANYLAERGITMLCPLLPGHGELPNKLAGIYREAWIEEVEEAYGQLRGQCDEILLMGHSMGTILGAHLAALHDDIRGIIMLAPAFEVPDKRLQLMRVLRYVMPWLYPLKFSKLRGLVHERLLDFDPTLDFDDPVVQAKLPEMTRVPTAAIDEMRKMIDYGRHLWPILDVPAILFQGDLDIAVSLESTQKLYDLLPNKDKQLLLFENAGHELMRPFEPVHEQVWPRVHKFVVDHSSLTERNGVAQSIDQSRR